MLDPNKKISLQIIKCIKLYVIKGNAKKLLIIKRKPKFNMETISSNHNTYPMEKNSLRISIISIQKENKKSSLIVYSKKCGKFSVISKCCFTCVQ